MARVGIHVVADTIKDSGGGTVLMPAYHCGSEISPFIKNRVHVELYRVRRDLSIDVEDVKSKLTPDTRAIYVIHYFGFLHELSKIQKICLDNEIILIEDCALSLLSHFPDGSRAGSEGDIAIYNFPKILPVPDGGAMIIHSSKIQPGLTTLKKPPIVRTLKAMLPFVKRGLLQTVSETPLFPIVWKLMKKKVQIDEGVMAGYPNMPKSYYYNEGLNQMGISGITCWLLPRFDSEEIRRIRKRNYRIYLEQLHDCPEAKIIYNHLSEGVCPLYFPILVNNRQSLNRKLSEMLIGSVAWWSGYHQDLPWSEYPDACYLKDHLLVLPVHQNLEEKAIYFVCRQFEKLLKKMC